MCSISLVNKYFKPMSTNVIQCHRMDWMHQNQIQRQKRMAVAAICAPRLFQANVNQVQCQTVSISMSALSKAIRWGCLHIMSTWRGGWADPNELLWRPYALPHPPALINQNFKPMSTRSYVN